MDEGFEAFRSPRGNEKNNPAGWTRTANRYGAKPKGGCRPKRDAVRARLYSLECNASSRVQGKRKSYFPGRYLLLYQPRYTSTLLLSGYSKLIAVAFIMVQNAPLESRVQLLREIYRAIGGNIGSRGNPCRFLRRRKNKNGGRDWLVSCERSFKGGSPMDNGFPMNRGKKITEIGRELFEASGRSHVVKRKWEEAIHRRKRISRVKSRICFLWKGIVLLW